MNTNNAINEKTDKISNIASTASLNNLAQGSQPTPAIDQPSKSRTLLWVGICFVILAMFIIFGLLVIPRTVHPCSIFSGYSHISLCSGPSNVGLLCSFLLGIPLNTVGASFILSSIAKKTKHEEAIMVTGILLITLFTVILTLYLLHNFIR